MKKMIVIFGIILSSTMQDATAQGYHPFPDSNAIWNNFYYGYSTDFRERFGIKGDTLINEILYNKIYSIIDDTVLSQEHMTYYAALRENESKQIFIKIQDWDEEILIYDFSLNIGDSMPHSEYPEGDLHWGCRVTDIDTIEMHDNQFRKRFKIEGGGLDYWIEGIGSVRGLFHPIRDYIIGSYCELVCFKYMDTVVYLENPECNRCFCRLLTPVEEEVCLEGDLNIYPNPASTSIKIELEKEEGAATISLINANGQTVLSIKALSFPVEVNTQSLLPGMYQLRITKDEKNYLKTFIKRGE